MRKEDEQAIKRAVAILKVECQTHERCKECPLLTKEDDEGFTDCVVNVPPAYLNADEIIECFT